MSLSNAKPYVLVIGYGMPGRAVAEMVRDRGVDLTVIELNQSTVERCEGGAIHMMAGDARNPEVLVNADVKRATLIVIAIPDEKVGLEVTKQARKLNPAANIVTRCHYVSVGFEARKAGANEVVIAEQVVAEELRGIVSPFVPSV
jgi:CPA2 family monovalent cation:H+ antiporter-2